MLRKSRIHKDREIKNRKNKNKKWFSKTCNDNHKELKIISKLLNRNPNNYVLRTKFYQLGKYIRDYAEN